MPAGRGLPRFAPPSTSERASSSPRFKFQPTSLTALAGLQELRLPAGGATAFGPENMELVRLVERCSEPGDLVYVSSGILGDFIYAMTGRYATRGMFHEVRPEAGEAGPDQADLAVIATPAVAGKLSGPVFGGGPLSRRGWSVAGGAGPYLVVRKDAKDSEVEEVKDMGTVLPMWVAYVLSALAALVVLLDAVRRRSVGKGDGGEEGPARWPLEPREWGAGEGNGTLVMIPARDEEGNVAKVVSEVRERYPTLDVLVLDDGSKDGTAAEALQAGAMVLRSEKNLGLGEMMRLGMAFALRKGYRAVVRLDGDGQHPVEFVPSLLWPVLKGNADVVVGSRFLEGGGYEGRITLPRRAGMAYFRFLLRLWVRRDFSDPTSGFRSYSRHAMSLLAERKAVRYPEVSDLHLLVCRDLVVREVPVKMRRRRNGNSSLGLTRALAMFWGATLTAFRPVPKRPAKDGEVTQVLLLPTAGIQG